MINTLPQSVIELNEFLKAQQLKKKEKLEREVSLIFASINNSKKENESNE